METPGRRLTRGRASITPDPTTNAPDSNLFQSHQKEPSRRKSAKVKADDTTDDETKTKVGKSSGKTNGYTNGSTNGSVHGAINGAINGSTKAPRVIDGWIEGKDPKIDYSGQFEFGGSFGTLAMMIGFPLLMYYMWIGATYYDGKFPVRSEGQTFGEFFAHLGHLCYQGAFPSLKAWTIYWTFFIFEGVCYILLPGITILGRPLAHLGGKQLPYYCSAVSSFYVTLVGAVLLHVTGIFKLSTIIDEFGPLMSVAIISGFLVSFIAYFSALYRGAQHRMTGYPIYDFFMGAELNPRMFGTLDFKMFFEVRLPWYILLLLTMSAAARQYEVYGYVSGEIGFLLMAHFLYANACSKGEECIISTW